MAEKRKPDFTGWVTRNDLLCSDGRIIRADAFAHQDGLVVPGCWNHQHNSADSVWGHVVLHSVDGGVRGDAYVNDTPAGQQAKSLVYNGDITNFSIFANRVKQVGKDVVHGTITEVSLVFAGANPGAKIDEIVAHDDSEGLSMVFYGEDDDTIFFHADKYEDYQNQQNGTPAQNQQPQNGSVKTEGSYQMVPKDQVTPEQTQGKMDLGAIIQTMNDDQKLAVLVLIGMALENAKTKEGQGIQPGDVAPENQLTVNPNNLNKGATPTAQPAQQPTPMPQQNAPVAQGAPVDTAANPPIAQAKPKEPIQHGTSTALKTQPDTPQNLPQEDRAAVNLGKRSPFEAAKNRIQAQMAQKTQPQGNLPQALDKVNPVNNIGETLDTIPGAQQYLINLFVGYALSDNKDPKVFEDPKVKEDIATLNDQQRMAIVEFAGYVKIQQDKKNNPA